MKKLILILALVLYFAPTAFSQNVTNIFNLSSCTWYGLDFSKVKLIGSEGFNDTQAIKDQFFSSWNYLVLNEPEKYNIGKAFNKQNVDYYLDVINERNKLPEIDDLVTADNNYSISEDEVKSIISEYRSEGKSGMGIVFIMESFNKYIEEGTMWVTFFDIESRKVLFADKLSGKAGGFGFRNYWAKTYYNVIKEVEKKKYKQWRKQFE